MAKAFSSAGFADTSFFSIHSPLNNNLKLFISHCSLFMIGTIFDIKHFAVHDGPGIRQTIFFKGCPLRCWWCHNPESQDINPEKFIQINKLDGREFKKEATIGYQITIEDLLEIILGDQVFFEESDGGVTFSGGEPLMQSNFLSEFFKGIM